MLPTATPAAFRPCTRDSSGTSPRPSRAIPLASGRAFTLLELLVAIAIIGLMVTLLMPALGATRQASRTLLCLNHMRQLGLATTMYVADFRGYYPRAQQGLDGDLTDTQRGTGLWFNAVDPYCQQALRAYAAGNTLERNYAAFKQCALWTSPAIENSVLAGGAASNRTIKMNSIFGGDAFQNAAIVAPGGFAHENMIRRRQPVVLFVDGRAQDVMPHGGNRQDFHVYPGVVALRHGAAQTAERFSGGANVVFTDGSGRLVLQAVQPATDNVHSRPRWWPDTAAHRASGQQELAWLLHLEGQTP